MRRSLVHAAIVVCLGQLMSTGAYAALVTEISVEREYGGYARVSNATTTFAETLSASETGVGSLGTIIAASFRGGVSATAQGIEATATLTDSDPYESILGFATSTLATHYTGTILVYTPSNGSAQANVNFLGTINTSAPTVDFATSHTSSGNSNAGTLRVLSNGTTELFSSSISSLPSMFSVDLNPGETATLEVTLSSSSYRGPGTFTNTSYSDSDSQSFGLTVSATAVPEPSLLTFFGACLGGGVLLRSRKRKLATAPCGAGHTTGTSGN